MKAGKVEGYYLKGITLKVKYYLKGEAKEVLEAEESKAEIGRGCSRKKVKFKRVCDAAAAKYYCRVDI